MRPEGITFREIVLIAALSAACAALYVAWGPVWFAARAVHPAVGDLIYGIWFIASVLAGYIVQKPGVAFAAEVAGASGELILGSAFGLTALLYGAAQGVGAELVLAAFRYRRFDRLVWVLVGMGAAVASLALDLFRGNFKDLARAALLLTVLARLASGAVLAGLLGTAVVEGLARTGVLNRYAVVRRRAGRHAGAAR